MRKTSREPSQKPFNFTQRSVEALPAPKEKRVAYHDTHVPELGLLVQPSGHRSYFWFCKVRGIGKWRTIGSAEKLTVEQARDKARAYNGLLTRWKLNDYQGDNPFEKTNRGEPTFGELVEDYLARHLGSHAKRPDEACERVRWSVSFYLAGWKNKKLSHFRRKDVRELHATLGETHGEVTANRISQLVRRLFNWSRKNEVWSGENPAAELRPFHEEKRTRFLQPDELARLFTAMKKEPNPDLVDFVNLSLWTGARKSDVLSMRWENIALADNRWDLPDPKNRTPYAVPLTPEAITILKNRLRQRADEDPWVFPGVGKSGHIVDLKKRWRELLNRANIPDLRQHDLRRTQGSWQAAQGASLQIIGKSLGHKSVSATQIYARLQLDPVRASMTAANQAMAQAARKKPKQLAAARE